MTCPICNKPYDRVRHNELSVYVYRKRCGCKRPMKKVEPSPCYDIRDVWRDEVAR